MPMYDGKIHINLKHSFWMGDITHYKFLNHLIRWANYLHDTDFIQVLWTDANAIVEIQKTGFTEDKNEVLNFFNRMFQSNKAFAVTELLNELEIDCTESGDLASGHENLYTFIDLKKIFDLKTKQIKPDVLEQFNQQKETNFVISRLNLTEETTFPELFPSLMNPEPSYVLMISFENYLNAILNTLAKTWQYAWITQKYLLRCMQFIETAKLNQMFYHIKDAFMMPLILPRFGGFYTDIDILPGSLNASEVFKNITIITQQLPKPTGCIFVLKQIKGIMLNLYTGRPEVLENQGDTRFQGQFIQQDVQILIQPFGINRFPEFANRPIHHGRIGVKRPLESAVPELNIVPYASMRNIRKKEFSSDKIKTKMDYFSEERFDPKKYESFRKIVEDKKDAISKILIHSHETLETWLKRVLKDSLDTAFINHWQQAVDMIAFEELHEFLFPDQTSQQHIQFLNDFIYSSPNYVYFYGDAQSRPQANSLNIGMFIGQSFFSYPVLSSTYNRSKLSIYKGVNELEIRYLEYWNSTLKYIFSQAPVRDLTTLVPHWQQTYLKKYLAKQNLAKHLFQVYRNTQDASTAGERKKFTSEFKLRIWRYILESKTPAIIIERQKEIIDRDKRLQTSMPSSSSSQIASLQKTSKCIACGSSNIEGGFCKDCSSEQ